MCEIWKERSLLGGVEESIVKCFGLIRSVDEGSLSKRMHRVEVDKVGGRGRSNKRWTEGRELVKQKGLSFQESERQAKNKE